MSNIAIEIWPYMLTALISAIGFYIGFVHKLKIEVAVLKKTVEDMQTTLASVQKRQDSHSKKQDDILESITDMKLEMVKLVNNMSTNFNKQLGEMSVNVGTLAADVKNLNSLISITDLGVKVDNGRKKK